MSTLSRRRFLTIAACTALAGSAPHQRPASPRLAWRGTALGADISITLAGPEDLTRATLARARLELEAYEARFSLFRAESDLVRLNRQGHLPDLDRRWQEMLTLTDHLHRETDGLFDPTIQPLWLAHATGGDTQKARALVGWERLTRPTNARRGLRLGMGQALSFNGIAQGAATDAVTEILKAAGMTNVLVDMGEIAALGGPWHLGAVDPDLGQFGRVALKDMAMAVSSPMALRLDQAAQHILHPGGNRPANWASVAVIGRRAAVADGLSTAGCFMTKHDLISCARRMGGISQILLLDRQGNRAEITL